MINFSPDINLGNAIVTAALGVITYGIRKVFLVVSEAVDRHDQALEDVLDHAEVLNMHSSILVRAGIADGDTLPMVDERRKKPRMYTGANDGGASVPDSDGRSRREPAPWRRHARDVAKR